jgi:hypothetical protein|tara:strand:- start:428 stop:754 length:327 start_codon:yes stop_codon:yes gene_type:complete
MSLRFPNKDPDETLDYSVDWSRFLGSATISGSAVWAVNNASNAKTTLSATGTVNGLTSTAQTISTDLQTATINLSAGTNNTDYTLFCTVTDSNGITAERSIKLRIRQK